LADPPTDAASHASPQADLDMTGDAPRIDSPPAQTAGSFLVLLRSPSVVAVIITAGAGLVGALLTHQINAARVEVERQKLDSDAILKTLELGEGDMERVRANLLFLIDNKIVRDPDNVMRDHLIASGPTAKPQACEGNPC
jgi:hypothetical protein